MEPVKIVLTDIFDEINLKHFDGFLEYPLLTWNSRLRSSAGRFIAGSRRSSTPENVSAGGSQIFTSAKGLSGVRSVNLMPPKIEIASYLLEETQAHHHVYDTLAHEMIHYWLWVRRRPYGHTPEFLEKMRLMGVLRYNPIPRKRPHKYQYQCNFCKQLFPARKKLGSLACLSCCKKYSNGKYDIRFKLILLTTLQVTR